MRRLSVDDPRTTCLSVAISTRDRPDAIASCLASLAQGKRIPDEVVVVDQSEGAATRHRIEAARSAGLDVRYLAQSERGLAVSQNLAIETASGAIVAVLDDDCIADSQWLAEIERVFVSVDAPDVLTGRVLPQPCVGERIHPVATRVDPRRRTFSRQAIPWAVGSGNNFALRREWFLRVGGCDERLGPGSRAREASTSISSISCCAQGPGSATSRRASCFTNVRTRWAGWRGAFPMEAAPARVSRFGCGAAT